MPIHSWNWFRAVGVGNDLKSWYGDNPQVEDGREGGNQEFDDDVSGQYEDEVNFMMRRLRLNFYRAEDMLLIYKRKQWAEEDAEFKKEQDRRKKEKRERMIKKNKQRRMEKMKEELRLEEERQSKEDDHLRRMLETLFVCPFCSTLMSPPNAIYQCTDGHTLCEKCRNSGKFEECPTCDSKMAGRNAVMERLALSVFQSSSVEHTAAEATAPKEDDTEDSTLVGEEL